MVDVRPGHLAHEGDLTDGGNIRPFLAGSDGGHGQTSQAMGQGDQAPDVLHGDPRHRAGGGEQDNIRSGLGKGLHIRLCNDVFPRFPQDAGGVHLPGSQNQPVPQLLPV